MIIIVQPVLQPVLTPAVTLIGATGCLISGTIGGYLLTKNPVTTIKEKKD